MSKYINTLIQLVELPSTNSEIANHCKLLVDKDTGRSLLMCFYTEVACSRCMFDCRQEYVKRINEVTNVLKKSS